MSMKAAHSADSKGISGHTRSHIISRLDKAAKTAEHLAATLSESESGASKIDVSEAKAYAALLRGSAYFEKQDWKLSLRSFATARVLYTALSTVISGDQIRDLLSETIDPSIRYAAYQLKISRSLPIPLVARQAFPHDDEDLVANVNSLDPQALKEEKQVREDATGTVKTINWRSREVRVEDASIAAAWEALGAAKAKLAKALASESQLAPKDMAAKYDGVLAVSQDAVDATKETIDELQAEGVSQSGPRMQSLYIARTAVNFEMISWRIGRNRVLAGDHDGALLQPTVTPRRRTAKGQTVDDTSKEEPLGRQVARLKEKVVLYDGVMQSLESVKELPGVPADAMLSRRLDSTHKYFNALKYVPRISESDRC
jgi:signal recognition particle subunit SRP68